MLTAIQNVFQHNTNQNCVTPQTVPTSSVLVVLSPPVHSTQLKPAFLSAANLLCCESFHWTYASRFAIGLFALYLESFKEANRSIDQQLVWLQLMTLSALFMYCHQSMLCYKHPCSAFCRTMPIPSFFLQNDAKGQKSVQIYKLEFFLNLFSTMFSTVLLQTLFYLPKSKFWLLVMASHIWWEDESIPPRLKIRNRPVEE